MAHLTLDDTEVKISHWLIAVPDDLTPAYAKGARKKYYFVVVSESAIGTWVGGNIISDSQYRHLIADPKLEPQAMHPDPGNRIWVIAGNSVVIKNESKIPGFVRKYADSIGLQWTKERWGRHREVPDGWCTISTNEGGMTSDDIQSYVDALRNLGCSATTTNSGIVVKFTNRSEIRFPYRNPDKLGEFIEKIKPAMMKYIEARNEATTVLRELGMKNLSAWPPPG